MRAREDIRAHYEFQRDLAGKDELNPTADEREKWVTGTAPRRLRQRLPTT
jgi:hypothetical protein